MKFLLDQGLPRSTASLLRDTGIDTVHTGEIGLATAVDSDILQHAQRESRVVVTLDADFHALLALSGASTPSVIRIRIEGLRAQALAASPPYCGCMERRPRRGLCIDSAIKPYSDASSSVDLILPVIDIPAPAAPTSATPSVRQAVIASPKLASLLMLNRS